VDGTPYKTKNMVIYANAADQAMGIYTQKIENTNIQPVYRAYVHGDWCGKNEGAASGGCNDLNSMHSIPATAFSNSYTFNTYLAFGTVNEVRNTLSCLYKKYEVGYSSINCSQIIHQNPVTADCSVSLSDSVTGSPVTWSAKVLGGKAPYSYYWYDQDGQSSVRNSSLTKSYTSTGMKWMGVAIIDANNVSSGWKVCSSQTNVRAPQTFTYDCAPDTSNTSWGYQVHWTASVSGGTPPYSYYWVNRKGELKNFSISAFSDEYESAGEKNTWLAVFDANQNTLGWKQCSKTVHYVEPNQPVTPISYDCAPSKTSLTLGEEVLWQATVSGGTPPYSYFWNGTDDAFTDFFSGQRAARKYATTGTKFMGLGIVDANGVSTGFKFCSQNVAIPQIADTIVSETAIATPAVVAE
jgi:hypothetical protein